MSGKGHRTTPDHDLIEGHDMDAHSSATEAVVRSHLRAFLDQEDVDSIVKDYDDGARLCTEARIYDGKPAIRGFFVDFLSGLPEGAIGRFELRSLRVAEKLAYITWSVGQEIPLGTDTFVVADGRIVAQTFAMYPPSTH
jgi:hypothetical protein